ncbi:MAG: sigma-70 family RNA polymerase sigma factor [Candidatus Nomurabacteria bacterium]|jgi:RNA polymerase primary sigma factor|nr:sigma-70 family RNA polymerase sigma factor [Candidatus Nomurabacteria bacterium]
MADEDQEKLINEADITSEPDDLDIPFDDKIDFGDDDYEDLADDAVVEGDWNELTDDSVRVYLREIGRIPMLSQEEEDGLAWKIVENAESLAEAEAEQAELDQKLQAMDRNDPERFATKKAFDKLSLKIRKLKQPKDQMAEANMRLVVSIAKRYGNRGLDFLDLIQEGNVGLMRAVEKFDPSKGFKFSTYATWWVRQAITRAIADQARTIRIPVHMVEKINKLMRVQRRLTQELNREPSIDELAKELDETPKSVEHIFKVKQDIQSLDATIGGSDDDDSSELGNFVEDGTAVKPEEAAAKQLLHEQILSIVNDLSDRERKIIKMRFGIDGGRPHTLEEVGAEFQVTRERIRQIESKALNRLKRQKDVQKLYEYLQ